VLFVGVAGHDKQDQISGRLIQHGAVAGDIAAPPVWDPATEAIYLLQSGGTGRAEHSWPGLHLAIATDAWCDADIVIDPGTAALDALWERRLMPLEANLRTGRRAPRRQHAVLADPDPTWPRQAQQLMERLLFSVGGMIIRADHIGSTSIPGLPAKQLIDIQVLVEAPALARPVADAARRSGFVRVPGNWFGTDQHGASHPEEVVVDADPGRPVNINIRRVTAPIWRETLLFRDWLRTHQGERDAYAGLKAGLAGRPGSTIDDYGTDKMPWISSALARAGQWAARSNWSPWETF
jgi:dephospho-CoA kinase